MRVAIVHNFYQQPGGEDQVFAAESALLEEKGHTVERITVHNDLVERMGRISLAAGTIWSRQSHRDLAGIFARFRPDVVHFHNTLPLISPAGYYAARGAGAAVVQTLHNYRLICPGGLLLRDGKVCEACVGKSVPIRGVVHRCYRGSTAASAVVAGMLGGHRAIGTWSRAVDLYIALTGFAREKFVAGGLPAGKIIVKPNFVHPDPGAGAHAGGFGLFIGRLSPEKGVETLLRATEQLQHGPLIRIAGGGPLEESVSEFAKSAGGVEALGRQSRESIFALMREAAFLVMPSEWYEGLPLTIIEAFATGLPVIASRLGAMAELIEDGVTGILFEPGDVSALTDAIRWAGEHPAQMAEMGRAARVEFERKYSAEVNYRLLTSAYDTAVARSAGRSSGEAGEGAPMVAGGE